MSEQNKQIEQEKISIVVGLAGKKVSLNLRMISIAEETVLRQRFAALTEEEKAVKEYQINIETLDTFSIGDLKEGSLPEDPTWQVMDYFRDQTPFKERVAEYAVRGFLSKLIPEISFQ